MEGSTPTGVADDTRDAAGAPSPSRDVVQYQDEIGMERLQRLPIIDRIDSRQLELIKRTVAVAEGAEAITNAELGHFLELCAVYGLDAFAREAWIAKSKSGKLLIMVGRDGLRKIAKRNDLRVQGDVICEKDRFGAEFVDGDPGRMGLFGGKPFHAVTHVKTGITTEERGPVVGAWSRVTNKQGVEVGYFDAPITEYRPSGNALQYSPWSKQVSAMMLGAVERQSIRQATPLGGLLHEGEQVIDSTAVEIGAGEGSGEAPPWEGVDDERAALVDGLVARAGALNFPGLGDLAITRMRLNGQSPEAIDEWIAAAEEQLATLESKP